MAPDQPLQVTNPLQWQVGHGVTPDGSRLCLLSLSQGALNAQVQLSPEDMERIGRALIDAASQAKSGLIIPSGLTITPNGKRE